MEAEEFAMAPVQLPCSMGSATCEFKTMEVETELALQLLTMHMNHAHPNQIQAPTTTQVKTGKIVRPRLEDLELKDSFVDEETFAFFEHRWTEYKGMASVTTDMAKKELSHCLSDEIQMLLFGRYGKEQYEALTETLLIAAIKEMVVRTRNKLVTRHKLRQMVQSHDQPIQTFLSSLKATARLCDYKVKCEDAICGKMVDFTDQMVMEQLTVGLADEETQRKLFMKPEISLPDAEKLVIAEEIGKLSQEDSRSVHAMSNYQKQKKEAAGDGDKKCWRCGGDSHDKEVGNTVKVRRKHCPAFEKKCEKCSWMGHYTRLCKSKFKDDKADAKNVKNGSESAAGVDEQLLGVSLGEVDDGVADLRAPCHESVDRVVRSSQGKLGVGNRRILRHMTYDAKSGKYVNTWENRRMRNLQVSVTMNREQYQMLAGVMDPGVDYQYPVKKEQGVADT